MIVVLEKFHYSSTNSGGKSAAVRPTNKFNEISIESCLGWRKRHGLECCTVGSILWKGFLEWRRSYVQGPKQSGG